MDTDPTGYASDIAVDLSLEFFPPRCKTRLNPLFALVDSKERLRIIQRVFDSKTCLYNVSLYFRFARFRQEAFFVRFSVEFVCNQTKLWLAAGMLPRELVHPMTMLCVAVAKQRSWLGIHIPSVRLTLLILIIIRLERTMMLALYHDVLCVHSYPATVSWTGWMRMRWCTGFRLLLRLVSHAELVLVLVLPNALSHRVCQPV